MSVNRKNNRYVFEEEKEVFMCYQKEKIYFEIKDLLTETCMSRTFTAYIKAIFFLNNTVLKKLLFINFFWQPPFEIYNVITAQYTQIYTVMHSLFFIEFQLIQNGLNKTL